MESWLRLIKAGQARIDHDWNAFLNQQSQQADIRQPVTPWCVFSLTGFCRGQDLIFTSRGGAKGVALLPLKRNWLLLVPQPRTCLSYQSKVLVRFSLGETVLYFSVHRYCYRAALSACS